MLFGFVVRTSHQHTYFFFLSLSVSLGLAAMTLTKRSLEELKRGSNSFRVVLPDIEQVTARVKHMNIVSYAEGMALYLASKKEEVSFVLCVVRSECLVFETDSCAEFSRWSQAFPAG